MTHALQPADDEDLRDPTPVTDIVDALKKAAEDEDDLTLHEIFDAVGQNSFSATLLVPALLVVTPLSGIPLFSSICGLTIAFISAQMLIRRDHLWMPEFLMRKEVDANKTRKALRRIDGLAAWLDRRTRPRLRFLVTAPLFTWLQVLCLLCGLAMPMLEIVPFSSSVLGLAVAMLATAMLVRDGLFALFGLVAILIVATIPFMAANLL
ncbi:exopolysaccharide biosynthesis protein [Chachezhania antarctica]|uniref:exopolysaccharide biosynthesis protein n=1 Tax=Chachezhania antarctica TaxID=2340860 RepID=UPI001F0918AC|nr:exopolysaccharide biosynthesis protein [Chachezhania antarctica]